MSITQLIGEIEDETSVGLEYLKTFELMLEAEMLGRGIALPKLNL